MKKDLENKISLLMAIAALGATLCSGIWFIARMDKDIALTEQLNRAQDKRLELIENKVEKCYER